MGGDAISFTTENNKNVIILISIPFFTKRWQMAVDFNKRATDCKVLHRTSK